MDEQGIVDSSGALNGQKRGSKVAAEPDHIASADCPCRPTVAYTDPITGVKVWRHNTKEQFS
jgi:hypothetical protein